MEEVWGTGEEGGAEEGKRGRQSSRKVGNDMLYSILHVYYYGGTYSRGRLFIHKVFGLKAVS